MRALLVVAALACLTAPSTSAAPAARGTPVATVLLCRFASHRRLPLPSGPFTVKSTSGGDLGLVEPLIANPYRYDGAPDETCIRFPSGALGGNCADPSG